MVVAGVGVDHDQLVDATEKYFVDRKPIWETDSNIAQNTKVLGVDKSVAQYTGGIVKVFLSSNYGEKFPNN